MAFIAVLLYRIVPLYCLGCSLVTTAQRYVLYGLANVKTPPTGVPHATKSAMCGCVESLGSEIAKTFIMCEWSVSNYVIFLSI